MAAAASRRRLAHAAFRTRRYTISFFFFFFLVFVATAVVLFSSRTRALSDTQVLILFCEVNIIEFRSRARETSRRWTIRKYYRASLAVFFSGLKEEKASLEVIQLVCCATKAPRMNRSGYVLRLATAVRRIRSPAIEYSSPAQCYF